MNLPVPPDAYWANVPWWAWIAFMVLGFVVLPFAIQFMRGKTSNYKTREEAALAGQAALDKQRDAFVHAVQSDRDAARSDLSRERAERHTEIAQLREDYRALDENRIEGWNRARGMEVVAHMLWHDLNGAVGRANALILLIQRVIAGKLSSGAATEMLVEYPPLDPPGPVPRLHEVDPKSPHETKYG